MTGPMLAASVKDLTKLKYPFLCSLKLDGIRAITTTEGPKTRSMKSIPNLHVRKMLGELPPFLDGELAVVDNNGGVNFRMTSSAIMRYDGMPNFSYFLFDYWKEPEYQYADRLLLLRQLQLPEWCIILSQRTCANPSEIEQFFLEARELDHEGLILRDPLGRYKHGRSTLREQGMLKMKPWEDTEAVVLDSVEEMENTNAPTTNEVGNTARSSHSAGKVPKGRLGTLVVRAKGWKDSFEIGTGFTAAERHDLWQLRAALPGRIVKFKYINAGGYDVPRHAVFLGFRSKEDL